MSSALARNRERADGERTSHLSPGSGRGRESETDCLVMSVGLQLSSLSGLQAAFRDHVRLTKLSFVLFLTLDTAIGTNATISRRQSA